MIFAHLFNGIEARQQASELEQTILELVGKSEKEVYAALEDKYGHRTEELRTVFREDIKHGELLFDSYLGSQLFPTITQASNGIPQVDLSPNLHTHQYCDSCIPPIVVSIAQQTNTGYIHESEVIASHLGAVDPESGQPKFYYPPCAQHSKVRDIVLVNNEFRGIDHHIYQINANLKNGSRLAGKIAERLCELRQSGQGPDGFVDPVWDLYRIMIVTKSEKEGDWRAHRIYDYLDSFMNQDSRQQFNAAMEYIKVANPNNLRPFEARMHQALQHQAIKVPDCDGNLFLPPPEGTEPLYTAQTINDFFTTEELQPGLLPSGIAIEVQMTTEEEHYLQHAPPLAHPDYLFKKVRNNKRNFNGHEKAVRNWLVNNNIFHRSPEVLTIGRKPYDLFRFL
ncbi:MAG: hypothetical protein KKG59_03450 [Nanoarchaeota archaeon]|nr:hypothetical protein [Nanoarchaeota archaeon]